MKFTLSWLKEYLETNATLEEICDKLTDIGLEVESVEESSKSLSPFSIAHIIEASPHPEADKLQICKVDVGNSNYLQIICGAANARKGLKVVYAPIGSVIPTNSMKIKKSKIRGVESNGMLCSAAELGLGEDSNGIIEIDNTVNVGTKITDLYGLNVCVIEVNITPNRGDCLGVYGIARDLASAGLGKLKELKINNIKGSFSSPISVKINSDVSNKCPYFTGRYIKDINNKESPKWLKDKLEAIGVNSISAVVDATNYVMYCLNHPLHAYDADKIKGDITVRNAVINEEFKSLNDIEYKLSGEELIIADETSAIGLAGIIGGDSTSSELETKNVFLEAAFFEKQNIARTGRKLNILSDSRYRFERGIDIATVNSALDMVANLIVEICGGQVSHIVEAGSNDYEKTIIDFDLNKISKVLGIEIEEEKIKKILQDLDFTIKETSKDKFYQVTVPSFRGDVTLVEDLIEEVIRIYGYNQVNSKVLPDFELKKVNNSNDKNISLEQCRSTLCNLGMYEIISWSFVNSKLAEIFSKTKEELFVSNPISVDMDYMRPSLFIGLLSFIKKNQARGFNNLAIFEIGKTFLSTSASDQKDIIAGIRVGKNKEKNLYKDERTFDCFDVKKDLFECLENFGINAKSVQISENGESYYHPFRSATIKLGKNIIGRFGELHPILNKKFDISGRLNAFELFVDELPAKINKSVVKKAFNVSDLPAVNRDFAFILDKEVKISDLIKLVEKCEKELINKVSIFDIYEGDKIQKGKKSVAFAIRIQPLKQTLTSQEIEQISDKIIKSISENLGGILRDGN